MISLFIEGTPAPQGSKKHVGRGIMVESSKNLPAWRKAVKEEAEKHAAELPIDQPVIVRADFFMPRPKKPMFSVPATAPDVDKLCRALGDGMEAGGLIKNDARIVRWEAEKHYGEPTGCRVEVTLWEAK